MDRCEVAGDNAGGGESDAGGGDGGVGAGSGAGAGGGDLAPFDPGALLRRVRRIARLSQRDLAARAGIPAATVARIESGATADPHARTLAVLLAAAGCRLTAVPDGLAGARPPGEVAAHPWENERDDAYRHFPAHLDLVPVNRPYEVHGRSNWWGWYRSWAWRPGARIPRLTFVRLRTPFYCPPLDPITGEPEPPVADTTTDPIAYD